MRLHIRQIYILLLLFSTVPLLASIEKYSNNTDIVHAIAPEELCVRYRENLKEELQDLHATFDNKIKCPPELSNKFIKFDYEHILGLKLLNTHRGKWSLSGFHHDTGRSIEESNLLTFTDKIETENGFYKAKLIYQGYNLGIKNFFPAHWSRKEVINKIHEAYDNFLKKGLVPELQKDGKYRISSTTDDGIKIEIYITKNGKVLTAYPVLP